jgi:hypothetical protein
MTTRLIDGMRRCVHQLTGAAADYDPLLERVGEAPCGPRGRGLGLAGEGRSGGGAADRFYNPSRHGHGGLDVGRRAWVQAWAPGAAGELRGAVS